MTPLAIARSTVLARIVPLPHVSSQLEDAVGTALAGPLVAGERVPPFDNSAVDGFAVRADDVTSVPATLRIVDRILAGTAPEVSVGVGEAAQIMTGAPVPPGADAVAMVERCVVEDGMVTISAAVTSGDHVRPTGDDVEIGDTVLVEGTTITPAVVGLLATLGVTRPTVVRRPIVGVLSTGDELVPADAEQGLGPGQIRDSNRAALCGLVDGSGFEAVDLGLVPDDEAQISDAIVAAVARCDALVTSGGVSMGDVDLVRVVLDRLGEMDWMQIAIKPAKPFAFGTISVDDRSVPVFGLPGNPVSSMVSYELLARPALAALGGHRRLDPPPVWATAGVDIGRRSDGKVHFVRVRFDGDSVVPAGGQGSHQLSALATADALAVLEDGEGVAAGDAVKLILLGR